MFKQSIFTTLLLTCLTGSFASSATADCPEESKVGYLNVFWKLANESVYFSLSSNDDPLDFQPLNNNEPVLVPSIGTGAVRDTSVLAAPDLQKYFILGTDLDINDVAWDEAERNGSRKIFIWESSDLVDWSVPRHVELEGETAGCVWAPDAIWDPAANQFLVHWTSIFYAEDDPQHVGNSTSALILRYAHTSDFVTFTEPRTYRDISPANNIDLAFLKVNETSFLRFYAADWGFATEISNTGLLGEFTRPADVVATPYEGPYPFRSNTEPGKVYVLADLVGGEAGIRAWETEDEFSGQFTENTEHDLSWMRHGSVISVTQKQYDALSALKV